MDKWFATLEQKLPPAPKWFPATKRAIDPMSGEPIAIVSQDSPLAATARRPSRLN